jgi:peptidoglycan hydrolase-like protein with peptidoglycan-binding domain
MATKRILLLFGVLGFAAVFAVAGWLAGSRIESPADVAARAAPPSASPILVPVEKRVLSSRFGLPQPISIAPSALKTEAGLIATLPLPNTQFEEGAVMLTASGRPLFVLQGETPAYRDLVPGISGDDVRQLEQALERLGFAPGGIDGTYDQQTSAAVAQWYKSKGWEPFGPTLDQLAKVRTLERDWGDARSRKLAAQAAAAAAVRAIETARATAEGSNRAATAELATRMAERRRLMDTQNTDTSQTVEAARAIAGHNNRAAAAEVAAQVAARALIALDPRQPKSAREVADAKLELAKSAARKTQLEGEMAIRAAELATQTAERDARSAVEQLDLTEAAVESARAAIESTRLQGEMAVQAALEALQVAKLNAKLAADSADRLAADLNVAKRKLGVQVPVDEIVFIPAPPVRVHEVTAAVGDPARGTVMSVTDNQLAIDSSLPLDAALLVKPGMTVTIDEQALGVKASGVVKRVANTPGTHGVDGYHIYFEVRVTETSARLEGFSLRLTIPIKSTGGAVTVVPISALSLAADGTSRVQVENNGALEYVVVEPGLSADGYVEVTTVNGTLAPGQLVVVGHKNPDNSALQ